MTIGMSHEGMLVVNGPLHDKVQCYGLLEAAKDAVRSHVQSGAQPSKLFLPSPGTKVPEPPSNGRHPRLSGS